jgi:hypothetical protein
MGEAVIKADCHSDDRIYEAKFDAVKWFEQAKPEEILALANCDWGGDYPADEVALFMAEHNEDIEAMFTYIDKVANTRRACGFECHVNEEDARKWLTANRPEIVLVEVE